ncbi:transposase [Pseudomonas veronii]|uniref:Transposase n=1 Tax=Pseudomonas veronii TaxID=76761 RepID=A0A4P7YDH5_PSEVE|nr:transposase [Pseudomonas veronii]
MACGAAVVADADHTGALNPRSLDRHLYKARNLVVRFFLKLKQFRRIATRHDRQARNSPSMLSLVSPVIWLA